MKNLMILFFIISFSAIVNAQVNSENELVGTWGVVKVTGDLPGVTDMPQEHKQKMEEFKKALLASKYIFKADKHFTYDIPMEEMKGMMTNVHWKFDKVSQKIFIQEWKDKDKSKPLIMELTVVKKGDKIIFVIDDTLMELEVKKLSE